MEVFVTILYIVSLLASLAGVVCPWWRLRRLRAKAERACAAVAELDKDIAAARDSGDDEAIAAADRARSEALKQPFEGGPLSLSGWTQPILFGGGTGASKAIEAERAKRSGLTLVAVGVVIGCIASILSVWFLPS